MKKAVLIFLAGAFSSLAMAPYSFTPALCIGLSLLYICFTKAQSLRYATLLGFVFSLGYFGFGLSWIGNALLVEGNPYWWAWPLAVSGLPIILSCFTALACLFTKLFFKEQNNLGTFLGFCALLSFSEIARSTLFTGFPWNMYAYTWDNVPPVVQLVAISDIYALNFLTVLWATSFGFLVTSSHGKYFKCASALILITSFCAVYLWGASKLYEAHSNTDNQIIIVQPNIKQSEKWKPEYLTRNFETLLNLSKYNPDKETGYVATSTIVWPETAINQGLINAPWAIDKIRETLSEYPYDVTLVTGALRFNPQTKSYFNSIVVFNKNAEIVESYDKSHLVPFGEYMPLENIIDIAPIVGFTGFKKGQGPKNIQLINGLSFSPLICYEIIFPEKSIEPNKPRPDFIINVTNDAWYGNSAGPYQHLVQTKFRAVETGLPVIRSANTGISAIINPRGKVEISAGLFNQKHITYLLPTPVTRETKKPNTYIIIGLIFIFSPLLTAKPTLLKTIKKQTRVE